MAQEAVHPGGPREDRPASTPAAPARRSAVRRVLRSGALSSRFVLPLVCATLDLALIVVAILAASYLRQRLHVFDSASDVDELVAQAGAPITVGWLLTLWLFGTYRPHQFSTGTDEYKNVVNGSVITAGVIGIVCYLTKFPLSRGFFVLVFLIGIPLLVLGRLGQRRALHRARARGLFRHRVLVAGDAEHIDEITTIMHRERWLGYQVVGALRADGVTAVATAGGVRYVGEAAAAATTAIEARADVIVVAGGAFTSSVEIRRAQWALEGQHVQVVVAPSVTDVARERVRVRPVAGLPLVHLERPKSVEALRWAKRTFDVVGASMAILVFSPVMLLAAVLVKIDDRGPVLFRQIRVGRDGQQFAMLKFRSMVVGAEAMLPGLTAANESDSGMLFKIAADPRITRHGRWMRRLSVDELPQLLNVLTGEMSLVGPRPALPAEVGRYDADVSRRLRVRPGITGLWQVSGRSDLSWEETVRLDLYYVDNWSMVQDLNILLRTLSAVFRSDGAY